MPRSRIAWLAAGIAALIFVVAGLSRISFNVDILKLLPTHLPQVEGLSLFLKHFAQQNELVITLEGNDAEQTEAAADALAAELGKHPELVKRAVARPPWEKNPADFGQVIAFLLLNQPAEKIAELKARLTPEQAPATLQNTLEKLNESVSGQEIALRSYDPFDFAAALSQLTALAGGQQQSEFSSGDGTFRVVYVESAKPFANYKEMIAWLKGIKAAAGEIPSYHGCTVGYTGEPAFVAEISASMEFDMMSSGFVTLALIALIFWLCYRRARPLLNLQLMLVLIFTISLAIAGLFLNQLTVIGVGCAAIMIGLSVDYGYFVYQRSLQHRGSVRELQRQCVQNIAWTAGTTAAVFFALNLSSLPGLSQLGSLVGIGVVVGAIVMLTVFAPLTMRLRRSEGERPPSAVERAVISPAFLRGGIWVSLAMIALLL
ncbi:MAG TPA: MMPL family transporter, partial [Chthoniobacteraceae bacterium]